MGSIIDLSAPPQRNSAEDEFSRIHYDTEIIHLQNYDNFYSLMDRLHQRDASGDSLPGILLIWPGRGKVLQTAAEFGRLRGWCARHGYRIAAVIPKDKVLLQLAKEQGIPAFHTVQEAADLDWDEQDLLPEVQAPAERARQLEALRKDAEQSIENHASFGFRLIFFLLAISAVIALFCIILPQARVEITPYLTTKTVNMTIWTDDRLDTPSIGGGIPTAIKKFELNLETTIPCTGTIQIEPGIAVGEVTVSNTCDRTQTGAAGSVLSTTAAVENGIRFITLDTLSVPPGEERTVRIEALNGGTDANLPAGSIQYADYPLSRCWVIRQDQPTNGGTDGLYATPTEFDRQTAMQQIIKQIPDAVQAALQNDPEAADLLVLEDAKITSVKKEQMLPESGFASDTLTLRQTVEVTIKTARLSDIETIIRAQASRLNAQVSELTNYEILSGPIEENGLLLWSVQADYLVYEPETNEEALQTLLQGKSIIQAYSILGTLEHVKESRITILPSWLNHLPLPAQNIHVTIHPAVEAETK